MSPDVPEGRYDYLVKALRKIAEGKTPEEIEAWKAEIDRGRHPQDYDDVSPVSCDNLEIVSECDESTTKRGHDSVTPDAKIL